MSEWTQVGRAAITTWAGLVALVALAPAQTTQGLISGRVVDLGSGRAIVAAEIRCELSDNTLASVGTPSVTRSDRSGYFTLPLLSPGFYRIHVQAATYQAQEVYQLEVPVAGRLDIQFRLRPLSDVWETRQYRSVFLPDSEAVLTFYGPDVDTSRSANFDPNRGRPSDLETSLSYVIGAPSIDRLPLGGRDVFTALVLLPSATADTTTGRGLGLSFGGQRPSASNYLLDGLEFNNSLVTGPAARIAPEAVQEYRVSTMNYTAEYGRTSGFIANAITRAATNEWHGMGYFYLKNEVLNANTFGNNLLGLPRLSASEIQPGGRFGGPVLKRRLFVSASLEYDRFRGQSNPQTFVLPTAAFINSTNPASVTGTLLRRFPSVVVPQGTANAGPVTLSPPTALDRYLAMTRFDYVSPSGVDQVFLRAVFSSIDQPDFLFNPYREFSSEYRQRDLSIGAGWTHRIRPHLINDLRVGFSFDDPRFSRPLGNVPLLTNQEDFAVGSDLFKVTLPGSGAAYAYRNRNGTLEALDTLVIARGS
ncbi:MAG TPA: carboxypeptidase-like regulatory domain-containing protein, partial [Bryobacteraceae bacterium]|nr:carboxypeptidase-like regulatory domain-containing protein [Bryobacteraceae bacterium]